MEKQYEIVKLLTSRLTNGANKIGFSKNGTKCEIFEEWMNEFNRLS